jgi:AraC-like DNA-binding protein
MITAHYAQDPEVRTPVLGALGDVVHIEAFEKSHLGDVVRLLARELGHPQIGTTAALNSLIDLLLIQFIRMRLDTDGERRVTWLEGMSDPITRKALAKIHEDPSHQWTTATLASAIHVSRATLTRRFPAATGQTPGAYLTRWRMDLAAVRLRDTDSSVEAIATGVGYTSAHAFATRSSSRRRADRTVQRHQGVRLVVVGLTYPHAPIGEVGGLLRAAHDGHDVAGRHPALE